MSPSKAVAFIKANYDIEMTAQHFSAVKSQLKKSQNSANPVHKRTLLDGVVSSRDGDLLDVLEGVKQLVDQYGVDSVKRMVDLLGRA
ncbi:hypothetical protein P12x_004632 [Tundrisphaera lichenicola]|uniref:hypothetical protein n=1 Tax=Tundrisphaera lichenicola TaxID=2029860 RepID=UPI003EBA17D3